MRFIYVLVALALTGQPARDPRVVVSVWYNGPRAQPVEPLEASIPDDVLRADLGAIRSAGFNGITTWISWRDGEPERDSLDLTQLDRLARLAREADLYVHIEVYTSDQPAWKKDGTNALAGAFYERVRHHYAGQGGVDVTYAVTRKGSDRDSIRLPPPGNSVSKSSGRFQLWELIARGNRRVGIIDALGVRSAAMRDVGEAAGVITRNQDLFGPLQPRTQNNIVTVDPARTIVTYILESRDAIVIIALNPSERQRRATLTFPPDVPEAIWQDMINGNAVNFVMGPNGPVYEHRFEGYETLVLAIRKKLR